MTPVRDRRLTALAIRAALVALVIAALSGAPPAMAARSHIFRAAYRGSGPGEESGTTASGSATMSGRGSLIGASTLNGSGHGVFTSQTCVVFSGNAILKGATGSLRLRARQAHACAAATDANTVSFSCSAAVTGGTATFAGHGLLAFSGTYDGQTGAVTISLHGRITY
jgi:hypothetical protein